jgi:hypothetical protein
MSAVHVNRRLWKRREADMPAAKKGRVEFDNYEALTDFAGFDRTCQHPKAQLLQSSTPAQRQTHFRTDHSFRSSAAVAADNAIRQSVSRCAARAVPATSRQARAASFFLPAGAASQADVTECISSAVETKALRNDMLSF